MNSLSLGLFKKCFIILGLLPFIISCASTPSGQEGQRQANIDPYEGFNRTMYRFNNGIDTVLFKPIAKGYKFVAPGFVESGVNNFFSNLSEVRNLFNAGLQGKGGKALHYSGRLLVNSTLGLLGFIDVAQYMGLEKSDGEDFGQTLASWGAGSGPYLVLPFLGPTTIRDGLGIPVDAYTDPINYVEHDRTRNELTLTKLVDMRSGLLDAEKLITGDKYVFIRDAYLQRREFLINDGKVQDNFGSDINELEDF
jgi:phospholipid-binding lipoprotein MlaA